MERECLIFSGVYYALGDNCLAQLYFRYLWLFTDYPQLIVFVRQPLKYLLNEKIFNYLE